MTPQSHAHQLLFWQYLAVLRRMETPVPPRRRMQNPTCLESLPPRVLLAGNPPSLVGWWQAEGNAIDAVATNNGVLVNGATFGAGRIGTAFRLNGANDFVHVPAPASLVMTNAVTLDAWIYPTANGSDPMQGGIIMNKEGEYEITRFGDGSVRAAFARPNGTWSWLNSNEVAPLDAWTHVAVTFSSGNVAFYINGSSTASYNNGASTIGDVDPALNDFRIGGRQSTSQFFAGRIDEARIYNAALTAAEISQMHASDTAAGNSAPSLRWSNNLATIVEDDTSNPGTLVSSLISGGLARDADSGALQGIAVTGVDNTNGAWEYTTDAGSNWSNFVSPAAATARLLPSGAGARIRFVPNANYSGTVSSGITFRAWDQTTGTAGATADVTINGGFTAFSAASASASIAVSPVNDAPVNIVPGAQTIAEDNARIFSATNGNVIGVIDVDAANNSIQVTLSVTAGSLTLASLSGITFTTGNGIADATMTFTGAVARINDALDGLTYVPPANASGVYTLNLTTNDLGYNGTGSALGNSDSVPITVTAVNDAPVNTLPPSQSVAGGGVLNLGASSGAVISIADIDAGLNAMRVTLSASTGTLTLASTAGLTFTSGDGSADSTMTFQGNIAAINNALNGMDYSPPLILLGNAFINITTSDLGSSGAGGAKTDADTLTIGTAPGNSAPVNSVPATQTMSEDGNLVFSAAGGNGISVADSDAGSGLMKISLQSTNGKLSLSRINGLTFSVGDGNLDPSVTFTGTLADLNNALEGLVFTPNADFSGAPTLNITSNDQGNSGSGGAKTDTSSVNIQVIAVNDAPVNAVPSTQTILEDTPLGFSSANGNAIVVSDVDAGLGTMQATVTATGGVLTLGSKNGIAFLVGDGDADATITFKGKLAKINEALAGLIFIPDADASGQGSIEIITSDEGNNGSGGTRLTGDSFLINITSVNDSPAVNAPGAQTGYEDNPLIFSINSGNAIMVSDVDATASGVEKVTLSSAQGALTLSTTAGLMFVTGDGASDSTMVFTGTLAAINTALDGLIFMPAPGLVGAASMQINVNDQGYTGAGGAQSASATVNLTLNATNQAPTISVPPTQSVDEDTALTFWSVFGNAITIADSDAGSGALRVTISSTNGALTLGGINGLSFNVGDGYGDATMTFTGTLARINAAIDGMTFLPAADFNGTAVVSLTVNDQGNTGFGGPLTATASVSVNVTATNDPPAIGDPGNQIINEDATLIFTGGTKINISDVDAGSGTLTVSLSTPNGRLTLSGTAGLTFTTGDGVSDGTLSFSGTLAAINAALDGLTFVPAADYNGFTSLQVYVQDQGNTGLGGPATKTNSISIQLLSVNDAPVNQLPASVVAQEDQPLVLSGTNKITITDVDAGSSTVRVSLWATNGRLTLNGTTGLTFIAGDGADDVMLTIDGTLSAINAALDGLKFDPNADFNGAARIRTLSDDLGNSGAGAPLADDDTLSFAVTSIDDSPTSAGLSDIVVDEDSPAGVLDLPTWFSDIDDPSSSLDYLLVSNTNAGLFTSAAIDPATHQLKLAYARDANGVAQILIRATDSSGKSVDVPLNVQVNPVNDAPVVAANTGLDISGASAVTITKQSLRIEDADNTAAELTYKLTRIPTGGSLALNNAVLKLGGSFTQADVDAGRLEYRTDGGSGSDRFDFIASDRSGAATVNTRFVITRTSGGSSGTPLPPPVVTPQPPARVPTPDPSIDDPKTDRDQTSGGYAQIPLPPFGHTSARPPSSKGTGGGTGDEPAAAPADVDPQTAAPAPDLKADAPIASGKASAPAAVAPAEAAPPAAAPAPAPAAPTVANNAGQTSNTVASAPRLATVPPAAPRPAPAPVAPQLTPAQSAQQVQFVTEAGKLWTELDEFHKKMTEEASTLHLVAGTASFVTFGMSIVYILWTIRAGYLVASLLSTMPPWRVIDPLPILDHFEDETERRRRRALEDGESLESLVDRPMVERAESLIGEGS